MEFSIELADAIEKIMAEEIGRVMPVSQDIREVNTKTREIL